MASSSNTENSISDQQVPTNLIPQVVIIDKDGPLIKKPRQARRETKPEEKSLLEPLVTCSEYPNDEQIEQVRELLGNEWDKDRIYQYISRHRLGSKRISGFSVKNRRNVVEKSLSRVKNDYIVA
ncbi:hypothetical protein RhiirA4_490474 [Rhizophagus irregularis]|uniref:Uncharacterized protein n=1 Tax=Rhizophagus irregularis TaxID=588596 RepID=A0A2I1HVU6_9GLOM|nr:hypothetical protein RhiirA4_490474 [Rhizophagus irregularis]